MMSEATIRSEPASDIEVIRRVVTAAFASAVDSNEKVSLLVDQLCDHGALTVSLVAENKTIVVDHVAFSPVTVDGRVRDGFGLAPLTVLPIYRRNGVGTRLDDARLAWLRDIGAQACYDAREPDYYGRFGFAARDDLFLENVPRQCFLAQSFAGEFPCGKLRYHSAFELCA